MSRCPDGRETPTLAPFQREAVARILEALETHRGAVLADEVGLGKSYVASEIARIHAARATEVDLIVPAGLVPLWTGMRQKFGFDAVIRTHEGLYREEIVPGQRRDHLLVVDEAHRFRNKATRRYRALALLAIHARILLITATPLCNGIEDLRALLALFACDDAFRHLGISSIRGIFLGGDFGAIRRVLGETFIRRTNEVLPPDLRLPPLGRSVIRFDVFEDDPDIEKQIDELHFPLIVDPPDRHLPKSILRRRAESSLVALNDSLVRQRRFYCRSRESLRDGIRMTRRDYRRMFGQDVEDQVFFQDVLFRELWTATRLAIRGDEEKEITREIAILDRLLVIVPALEDRKIRSLQTLLEDARDCALVFTSLVATARMMFRALSPSMRAALVTSREVLLSGRRRVDREDVFRALNGGDLDVLVSTDVGSEGLNLQGAGLVVHYDLPWNPAKVDQRNGRANRIGQRRALVRSVYFIPSRREDRVVAGTVARKSRLRRSLLARHDEGALDSGLAAIQSRLLLPSHVSPSDPQSRLALALERDKLLTRELIELLSRRYRAGIEIVLEEMAAEYLDALRVEYLRDLLSSDMPSRAAERRVSDDERKTGHGHFAPVKR